MKSEEELKNIARQIFDLELKCRNGINVPQNMAKIEQLIFNDNKDICELASFLYKKFKNIDY